jgi:hypothetical protein
MREFVRRKTVSSHGSLLVNFLKKHVQLSLMDVIVGE